MVIVTVVFPLLLLLSAVVTQLAANGALRRNRIVGIRVRSTLSSDAGWVAGHKAAAPWVWIGFGVSAVAGTGVLLLNGAITVVLALVVVVALIATVTVSIYLASRAARSAATPVSRR